MVPFSALGVALQEGVGLRTVARQWGLSKTAVGRHRTRHLEATAAQVETPAPPTAVVVPPVPPRISLLSHRIRSKIHRIHYS